MNCSRYYVRRLLEYAPFVQKAEQGNIWGIQKNIKDKIPELRKAYRYATKKTFTEAEHIHVSTILTNLYPPYKFIKEHLRELEKAVLSTGELPKDSTLRQKYFAAKNLISSILWDIAEVPKLGLLENPKKWQESPLIHAQPSASYIRTISSTLFDYIDSLNGNFERIANDFCSGTISSERANRPIEEKILHSDGGDELLNIFSNIQHFLLGHFLRSVAIVSDEELAIEFITFHFSCCDRGVIAVIPDYLREQRLYQTFPFRALNYLMSRNFQQNIILGWSEFNCSKIIKDATLRKCVAEVFNTGAYRMGYYEFCSQINKKYTILTKDTEGVYNWDVKKHIATTENNQYIAETLERRLGQNGIHFDSSIMRNNHADILKLIARTSINHIIRQPIHVVSGDNPLQRFIKTQVTHVHRNGKSWQSTLPPDEKEYIQLPVSLAQH